MKTFRRAFTLVELTFVIMIFGIVAAISAEVYAKIYENYLVSRVMNTLQTKTELALEQISNKLQYRIKSATIATKPDLSTYIPAADPALNEGYRILEWIGYDELGLKGGYDATLGYFRPAWSGLIDVDSSTESTLSTPGSDLTLENSIIAALSNSRSNIADAAIIFPETDGEFDISKFGWYSANSDYVYDVLPNGAQAFTITDPVKPEKIYERYMLAWSAYAIAPDPIGCVYDCTLSFYWNYQPWKGEQFLSAPNVMKSTLIEHVTTFKFKQDGDVMRIKLCVRGQIVDKNVSVCKEKVVF
ncbi:type II secretion system protein [Hydrogenimonas sp.]